MSAQMKRNMAAGPGVEEGREGGRDGGGMRGMPLSAASDCTDAWRFIQLSPNMFPKDEEMGCCKQADLIEGFFKIVYENASEREKVGGVDVQPV